MYAVNSFGSKIFFGNNRIKYSSLLVDIYHVCCIIDLFEPMCTL